jgi:hypothetical protein
MITRALSQLFRTISDEAEENPAFAARLEASLVAFAKSHAAQMEAERRVGDFHPIVAFRTMGESAFLERLSAFRADDLRSIIRQHNLDPSGRLAPRASRKVLTEQLLGQVKKRADRDSRLFDY